MQVAVVFMLRLQLSYICSCFNGCNFLQVWLQFLWLQLPYGCIYFMMANVFFAVDFMVAKNMLKYIIVIVLWLPLSYGCKFLWLQLFYSCFIVQRLQLYYGCCSTVTMVFYSFNRHKRLQFLLLQLFYSGSCFYDCSSLTVAIVFWLQLSNDSRCLTVSVTITFFGIVWDNLFCHPYHNSTTIQSVR